MGQDDGADHRHEDQYGRHLEGKGVIGEEGPADGGDRRMS